MNLSSQQLEIVNTSDKYSIVIAGAGSGKTRTLTERIKKLLSTGKPGEKILAITFSNKAANELNERLMFYYTKEQLEGKVFVGTVHNFCMELVLSRGSAIGLAPDLHIFESTEDRLEIFKEALDCVPEMKQKYCQNLGKPDNKKIKKLFEALSKAKRDFKFPSDYNDKPLSLRLYNEYNNLMLAQNAIDFDDILLYAYRILTERTSVAGLYQRIYKHICVDEAQDLNRAQYEVIKAIAGQTAGIFMVGDPNQAIYGFNGSSSKFMCIQFPQEFSASKFVLVDNYRSSKEVIDAAKIIEPSFEMMGKLPIQGECKIYQFNNEIDEANWIIDKMQNLLIEGHKDIEGGKITLQQCAIIARNKYVFSALEKQLTYQKVEYQLRVSSNNGLNSESGFFKAFDLGLRLLMNTKDTLHLSELIKLLGLSNTTISSFDGIRHNPMSDIYIGEQASTAINSAWDAIPLGNATFQFSRVLDILGSYCKDEHNFTDDNERLLIYKDYESWTERWKTYAKSTSIDDRSLPSMMRSIALGMSSITKEGGLTLTTVHMSKGLEFDLVFIMGLNEGVFPDYRAKNDAVQLDEERHNMFVSITRSKRLCYLSYPLEKDTPWGTRRQTPSQFVNLITNSPILKEPLVRM